MLTSLAILVVWDQEVDKMLMSGLVVLVVQVMEGVVEEQEPATYLLMPTTPCIIHAKWAAVAATQFMPMVEEGEVTFQLTHEGLDGGGLVFTIH